MSDYPDSTSYVAPHTAFKGLCEVQSKSKPGEFYEVDFSIGECTCSHGKAWRWSSGKWIENSWCTHKMRAAASIISALPDGKERDKAQIVYNGLLGKRYIIWESISAFHKELRRGDVKQAQYWALSVAAHRGLSGVIRYMLNIIFEETRDLDLFLRLLRLIEKGRSVEYDETMNAVALFCHSPKKWELEPRLEIFLDEMRGYRALANDFSYAVARAKDIIPPENNAKLEQALITGLKDGDRPTVQYGIKGLFKSIHVAGHDNVKVQIFNILTDALNGDGPFKKRGAWITYDDQYTHRLHGLVMRRYQTIGDMGYHELNALCDALTGESYPCGSNTLPKQKARLLAASPRRYNPPLGAVQNIPLYALDNHNHRGKHLMRQWGATELQPGAEQKHLDFRWCGAYMGVAWRYLAYKQHGTCEVKWGDVKWSKTPWLYKHLDSMWY